MKRCKKLLVGLGLMLSLGVTSLTSCGVFGDDGYTITSIETFYDEEAGYTTIRITTSQEEDNIITFTVSDGVTGNGIASISGVPSSDGKSVIVTITYTDPNTPDTVFTIPVVSGKDGKGISSVSTDNDKEGNVVVTFTYTDGTSDSFTIPEGIDGKDGHGIDHYEVDTTDPNVTVITFYFDTITIPPVTIEIPHGEDGVSVTSITQDINNSTNEVAVYIITYSDGSTSTISIDIPQPTMWYHGVNAPTDSTGRDGDYYLNTSTGVVYVKYGGTWVEIFSMRGNGSPIDFDVKFNPYDGTWDDGTNSVLVFKNIEYGDYLDLEDIPVPVKTGYEFDGWYTAPSDSEYAINSGKFTDLTPILKDMTLYPRWTNA